MGAARYQSAVPLWNERRFGAKRRTVPRWNARFSFPERRTRNHK